MRPARLSATERKEWAPFDAYSVYLVWAVGNGSVATGMGRTAARASMQGQAMYSTPNQPFEDVLLRQRTLGQDIIPSPREPKRTESLYTPQKPAPAGAAAAPAGKRSGKLKVGPTRHSNSPPPFAACFFAAELPKWAGALGRVIARKSLTTPKRLRSQGEPIWSSPVLNVACPVLVSLSSHSLPVRKIKPPNLFELRSNNRNK